MVVVEAGVKGGALITARLALDQGITVGLGNDGMFSLAFVENHQLSGSGNRDRLAFLEGPRLERVLEHPGEVLGVFLEIVMVAAGFRFRVFTGEDGAIAWLEEETPHQQPSSEDCPRPAREQ